MRRFAILLSIPLLAFEPAAAVDPDPVAETLASIKAAYRAKRLDDADQRLRTLSELLSAPEREAVRPRALPAYHFYSAAVAWERHDAERAKTDLERFFAFLPSASIDPAAYPKSFVSFFEGRRDIASRAATANAPPAGPERSEGGILGDYATRGFDPALVPAYAGGPEWIGGPARHLLTDKEVRTFKKLQSDDERRDFVRRFWDVLDPDPRTAVNEFEVEFHRRVQYADANFSTESSKGSETDRGMVFVVLGPPSYAARSPLRRSQDPLQVLRGTQTSSVADGKGGHALVRVESGALPLSVAEVEGEIESWYYRRDRVPRGIPYNELQFMFVSRTGYGTAVLEKEPRELTALRRAARLLRRDAIPVAD